jgi:hypothetical protein
MLRRTRAAIRRAEPLPPRRIHGRIVYAAAAEPIRDASAGLRHLLADSSLADHDERAAAQLGERVGHSGDFNDRG